MLDAQHENDGLEDMRSVGLGHYLQFAQRNPVQRMSISVLYGVPYPHHSSVKTRFV